MTNKQWLELHKELTQKMYEISEKKNHDYTGDNDDPFKNFRMVEELSHITTEEGFYTRMVDKMSRISTAISGKGLKVNDEKMEDTLLDLANYCLLFIGYVKSKDTRQEEKVVLDYDYRTL